MAVLYDNPREPVSNKSSAVAKIVDHLATKEQ